MVQHRPGTDVVDPPSERPAEAGNGAGGLAPPSTMPPASLLCGG